MEQRQFVDYAIDALGTHPLANDIKDRLKELVVAGPPDLSGYEILNDLESRITNCNGLDLQFDGNYGNIISFVDMNNREWASKESPFGIFEYVSYDETDFNYMCDIYTTGCYNKKGSQPYDIRNKWQTKMDKLYVMNGTKSVCSVVTHLTFPETTYTQIGAPIDAYLNITSMQQVCWYCTCFICTYKLVLYVFEGGIFMEVLLMNKSITRLPEAMFLV